MLLVVLLVQLAAASGPGDCSEDELRALAFTEILMERGDHAAMEQALSAESAATPRCSLLELSRSALRGWTAARELAPKGGAPGLLAPVQRHLTELEQLARANSGALDLEGEYAVAAIRAAVAAAQDERPEMALWLTHARDLSERLAHRDRRGVWPRPFNILAGELWFEVDRYEDAREAFARAVSADPTPLALVGLARAEARLDLWDQACATYARVRGGAAALRQLAASELTRCR